MPPRWRSAQGQNAVTIDEPATGGGLETTQHDEKTPKHAAMLPMEPHKTRSKRSFSRSRGDIDRPKTADIVVQSTSSNMAQPPPRTTSRAYVANVHKPPVQHLDFKTAYCLDEDMIGMALGSPSHPPLAQANLRSQADSTLADTRAQSRPEGVSGAKGPNVKVGKWKTFGGLFKPKHPAVQDPLLARQVLDQQRPAGQGVDIMDSTPRPLAKETPKVSKAPAHHQPTTTDQTPVESATTSTPHLLRTQLPKLEVDIPDVQLDRYSVMFGNLLNGQKSNTLLARRSRVLERLQFTSDNGLAVEAPAIQQNRPNNAAGLAGMGMSEHSEQLKPPPSTRRATSPTPGKSPIFSLFPQPPSTPRKAAAMTSQAKPTPLQRSFTAPSRLSPMQETFGTKKPAVIKPHHIKRRKSSVSLVETSASTTQGPCWSTDGSCLSPNSSVSSVGDEILFDIKKLSMVTENQEPQYEVTKPDGETVELYRALSKRAKATKPQGLKLTSKYAKGDATHLSVPQANESMPRSSDAAGKAAVDGANDGSLATTKSLDTEYLLPSTQFRPTTQRVDAAKERSIQDLKPPVAQVYQAITEVKERPTLVPKPTILPVSNPAFSTPAFEGIVRPVAQPIQTMMLGSDSPIEADESAEASQDILAAAVMGTLNHMGEQSSLRAASPLPPESPEIRASTPVEKPIKLLAIPKNIPISKYSLRSPTASQFKADLGIRSSSPQLRRIVTEPTTLNQSYAMRATRLPVAPAVPNARVKKTITKPNTSSKVVPAQSKGNRRPRGAKPDLSIVAPKPTASFDSPNSALSPVEVTVARQVSLARKQSRRTLIPPPGRRLEGLATDEGEKMVNSQALMPVIVDANKAHRPGKSLALVIENA